MAKEAQLKTKKTKNSVTAFIDRVKNEQLKNDCRILLNVFKKATRKTPKMWGSSIVGYGEYSYKRSNGDEFRYLATGFSPRATGPVIYILPGYNQLASLLKKLGPHKLGKSCLYLKNLSDIDLSILEKLIALGLKELQKKYPAKD